MNEDNAVVIDIKGELYKETHKARERMGHKIIVYDPFNCVTENGHCLNPLDLIAINTPLALDELRRIASAIVIRPPEEKEPHWCDGAEAHIFGASVAAKLEDPFANLQDVADILADPVKLANVRVYLREYKTKEDPLAHRLISRAGHQLSHFIERELGSVLTTTAMQLRWLGTPAVFHNTTRTTWDPREIVTGKVTAYLVLPPNYIHSHAALLRVQISTFINVIVQAGITRERKINFILDEIAALGKWKQVEEAITTLRGYGVNLHLYVQSLGQLETIYPKGQAQTVLSNMSLQVYLAPNDYQTCEHISKLIGNQTIRVVTGNSGGSRTRNFDAHGLETGSTTSSDGVSESFDTREVMRPEEVRLEKQAFVFMQGEVPALVTPTPYFSWYFQRQPLNFLAQSFKFALFNVAFAACLSCVLWDRFATTESRVRKPQPIHQPIQQPIQQPPRWVHAPSVREVAVLARNVCEAVRASGSLVTKETVFEALEAIAHEAYPQTNYFSQFSRIPEEYRRTTIIMLGEIMEALELDTDIPLAEAVE